MRVQCPTPPELVDAIDTLPRRVEKAVIRMHFADDVDRKGHTSAQVYAVCVTKCVVFLRPMPWISTGLKPIGFDGISATPRQSP
jgi:hypothetical protein